MSNYRQSTVTGEAWTRAVRVVIENPLDAVPSINFVEQRVVNLPDQQITTPTGNVIESFTDPAEVFSLLNPITGDVAGQATYQDVYVLLHSLYLHCAAKRDVAQVQAQP